jgi:hypothetical protein
MLPAQTPPPADPSCGHEIRRRTPLGNTSMAKMNKICAAVCPPKWPYMKPPPSLLSFASVALVPNGAAGVRGGPGVVPGVVPGWFRDVAPAPDSIISHWPRSSPIHCKGLARSTDHALSSLPSDLLAGFAQGPQGPKAVPSADSIPSSRSSLTSVGRQMPARDGWRGAH